ncbi:unnamed protein product [Diamesa hyperborea]
MTEPQKMSDVIKMTKLCNKCKKTSTFSCSRCEDGYCSVLCQQVDWQRHRYLCFPMPPLILNDNHISDKLEVKDGKSKLNKDISVIENQFPRIMFTEEYVKEMFSESEKIFNEGSVKSILSDEETKLLDEARAKFFNKIPIGTITPVEPLKTVTPVAPHVAVTAVDPPQSVVEADPVVKLISVKQHTVTPAVQPIVTPVVQPIVTPVVQPIVTPVVQPIVTPVVQPIVTPVVQPIVTPVVQPIVTPVVQPIVTPAAQPTITPVKPPVSIPQGITPAVMIKTPTMVTQGITPAVMAETPVSDTQAAGKVEIELRSFSKLIESPVVTVKSPVHVDHEVSEQPKEESLTSASQLDQSNSKTKRFFQRDITYHKWPERKHIKVRLLSQIHTKNFTIVEDIPLYDQHCNKIIEDIANYIKATDETSYSPLSEELVLAKFEGDFYRAVVLGSDIETETYTVLYLDYGNINNVEAGDMVKFPEFLLEAEVFPLICHVKNYPETLSPKTAEILLTGKITIDEFKLVAVGNCIVHFFGI